MLRIVLVPVLVILVVYGEFGWALIVFGLAGATDALDGLMARRRDERTALGALLDPLADKLLVASSFIVLSLPSPSLPVRVPPWIAILSISRDAGILLAVAVLNIALGRRSFPPSVLGKATTTVQLVTILWIVWCNYRGAGGPIADAFLAATVVMTIASGMHYAYLGHKILTSEQAD